MGWEERNGKLYYYRKKRVGGTVVSEYIGSGSLAELIVQVDNYERTNGRMRREEERRLIEADLEIDRELDYIGDLILFLTRAAFLGAGFHTHKGQWRKKRNGK